MPEQISEVEIDEAQKPESCFTEPLKAALHKAIKDLKELPMDVGPQYEGQRIRKPSMYLEFGGPGVEHKFELFQVRPPEEVEDEQVKIIGPDINELEPGGSYPLGIHAKVAGEELEENLEGVLERRNHYFTDYIEDVMHLNQRTEIWLRLSKDVYNKGLNSLRYIGSALIKLFKSEFPIIKKMEIDYYTDLDKVAKMMPSVIKVYEKRDERARGLSEADVEEFYDCTLCQSFAPAHVCIITPDRMGGCGSIGWLDARASYKIDPKGPNHPFQPGKLLDPKYGTYEGINKHVNERSLGAVKEIALHTIFKTPHTSCGCFEAICFYIPEVDGIGIVHRKFLDPAVNGLKFSTLAGNVGGGTQQEGFLGVAVEYLRSKKFLQADGGWERVVWMPQSLKELVRDFIPEGVREKIATEADVKNLGELEGFLRQKAHPVTARPAFGRAEEKVEEAAEEIAPKEEAAALSPVLRVPAPGGGVSLILKNVRISAERAILKREKKD